MEGESGMGKIQVIHFRDVVPMTVSEPDKVGGSARTWWTMIGEPADTRLRPRTDAKKIYLCINRLTSPGDSTPLHKHDDSEEGYFVIRGKGKIITDAPGEEFVLEQYDTVFCPPGSFHQLVNIGNEPLWTVAIGAPPITIDGRFIADLAPSERRGYEDEYREGLSKRLRKNL